MLIFKEEDIRQEVAVSHAAIEVVEQAFASLASGHVQMPPIMSVDIPEHHGEVDVKTAYIQGLDKLCIKISTGFFRNYELGLPSGSGMMLLVSAKTGVPQAILADNGYLTHVRTAAAGAVAAHHLAPGQVDTVGVIGAGAQAQYQLKALKLVRSFSRILVYAPSGRQVEEYARTMERELGVQAVVSSNPEEVVRGSGIVVTTTPATSPIIREEWLHPGLHITAMGSDAPAKQELEGAALARADVLVCDVRSQCFRLGELHHGLKSGAITEDSPILELGEIVSGRKRGRTSEEQITICDLTGTGAQDTAIAAYAYDLLVASGKGLAL